VGLVTIAALGFLIVKLSLLPRINVNWDEFMFLSRVHEFARGELATSFQTFHVHLFGWLAGVSGTEVDQVMAARRVAFGMRVASVALVFLLAMRVANAAAATVAALATLTFSHLVRHGESFRADPLIAFLFLLGATLLAWRVERVTAAAVAGIAIALAASISVKTAIYAPALACLLFVLVLEGRGEPRRRRIRGAAVFAAASVVGYAALYLYHAEVASAARGQVIRNAIASGGGMVGNAQAAVFIASLRADWFYWALCAAGAGVAVLDAIRGVRQRTPHNSRAVLLVTLLLPLASLAVYRNSYEYFYVTVVPLGALAVAYALARLERHVGVTLRPMLWITAAAVLALQGFTAHGAIRGDEVSAQRQVLAAVHDIFPEPVPYLDRCGMVSTFPAANIFMSTYVTAAYRRRGQPEIRERVSRYQPKFLLANVRTLGLDSSWSTFSESGRRLLREDFEFLQDNFVRHWGPVWVAGKRLTLSGPQAVEIVVAGPYTVEAPGPVMIDSASRSPGDIVELSTGMHQVSGTGEVTLRWGARLPRPAARPPLLPLFRGL
jgi:hypothetical protein